MGNLQQPFYYNAAANAWRKLTYYIYPLDNAYAVGGVKTSEWNLNGTIVSNPTLSNQVIDVSGFTVTSGIKGYGTIISTGNITINGQLLEVKYTYVLPQNSAYVKITTRLTNLSSGLIENVRTWVGTRDDWVGQTDSPRKQRGGIVAGAFVQNTTTTNRALALKISTGAEGVLFYTTSNKANVIIHPHYGAFLNNVVQTDPNTSTVDITSDGSYGMYVRMNDLPVGGSDEFTWYYAAGELAELDAIIADVADASGAVSDIYCTTATFKATTSIAGNGYYMVVPQGSSVPTALQIKNGGNYGAVTVAASGSGAMQANVELTYNITGLTNGTNYTLYFVSEDATPAFSTIATTNFSTLVYGVPVLTTTAISSITPVSAASGGIVEVSCENITARGICWNTSGNPTLADNVTTDGTGPGGYSSAMSGLTIGTTYYVRAYATNLVGTGYGAEYSFVASLVYCNPSPSTYGASTMWITNVTTTGGITNFNNTSGASPSSYTNYANSNSVSQIQGGIVNMSFSSQNYGLNYAVWVDFNDNGDFSDAGEQVIAISNGSTSASTSFTLPANAPIGNHRMRVMGEYSGYAAPSSPCGTLQYGETEDYNINVLVGNPDDPTSISASLSTVCSGSSTTLTANGAIGTVNWYSGSCGGTFVGTGNPITVSPTSSTDYFAQNFDNGQPSLGCASTSISVTTAPTISCTSNITANNDANVCGATVTYPAATATGVPSPTITYSAASGSLFPVGTTTVTATATNSCGTSTCSFDVIVVDNQAPAITCTSNQTLASCETTIPDYTTSAVISDNCSSTFTVTQSPVAGSAIAPGATTTVTITATDASNNSSNCSFTVNRPNITPSAVADVATVCAGSSVIIDVLTNDTHPQGTPLTISENTTPSSGYLVKNANNTFTYTPSNPSATQVTFTYTVKADDGVIANSSNNHYYEWVPAYGISWTGAKADALTKTFNGLQGYLVTVTSAAEMAFVASKLQGSGWMGASDLSYEGTWRWVTGPEGLEDGGLGRHFSNQNKAGGNCSAYTSPGINGNYANWAGGEPNDCGAYLNQFSPTLATRGGEHYAHFYGGGIWNDYPNSVGGNITGYIVEYGGLESCTPELTSTATVTINVNPQPVLSTATTNVTCIGGSDGAIDLSVTGGTPTMGVTSSNLVANNYMGTGGTAINLGTTFTVASIYATAKANTSAISAADFRLLENGVQVYNFSLYPSNYGYSSGTFTPASPVQVNSLMLYSWWNSATAVTLTFTTPSGYQFTWSNAAATEDISGLAVGTYSVTVSDLNSCSNTTSATLIQDDQISPVVITQNQTIYLDANGAASITVPMIDNASFDNCSIATLTLDNMNFDCSNIGANTVTLTATDANGNVNSATATVTVLDAILPTVLTQNQTIYLDAAGQASITVPMIDNASFDNCSISTLTLDNMNFTCSNVGANTVTLTATDANGNVNSATATVTVVDAILPTVLTQNQTIYLDANGAASITVPMIDNSSFDNCSIATLTLDNMNFDCSNVGANTVTLTATDANGNINTATATVTVLDAILPTVLTQNQTIYLDAAGQASITVPMIDNSSFDNCSIATLTLDNMNFSCSDVGSNTVTLTAIDVNGNVNSATASITVIDNVAPIALCQEVTVVLSGGTASITPQMIDNGSNDACGIQTLAVSPNTFDCSNIGANTVTLTVTDVNGNISICQSVVTVIGVIPSCTIDVTLANNTYTGGDGKTIFLGYGPQSLTATTTAIGGGPFTYSWTGGNSYLSSTTSSNPIFTPTAAGLYTLVCTVTNSYGCETSCDVTICVLDIRAGGNGNNQKVYICHVPKGNPNNAQTLKVSVNAVPSHLSNHGGDKLGSCDQSCGSFITKEISAESIGHENHGAELSLYPNPSDKSFNFLLISHSEEEVSLYVYDISGRLLIEQKSYLPNDETNFGKDLPAGVFFVKIIQGEFIETVKVVKVK